VCEQDVETLTGAWHDEYRAQIEKEEKQRREMILGNWKRLYRGLLIRHDLELEHNKKAENIENMKHEADKTKTHFSPLEELRNKKRKELEETNEKVEEKVEIEDEAVQPKKKRVRLSKTKGEDEPKAKVKPPSAKNGKGQVSQSISNNSGVGHVHSFRVVSEDEKAGTITRQCGCGLTLTSENLM